MLGKQAASVPFRKQLMLLVAMNAACLITLIEQLDENTDTALVLGTSHRVISLAQRVKAGGNRLVICDALKTAAQLEKPPVSYQLTTCFTERLKCNALGGKRFSKGKKKVSVVLIIDCNEQSNTKTSEPFYE